MNPPLRPILFTLTERDDIVTLRDAVEWYKKVVRGAEGMGNLTVMEQKYVNGEWAQVVKELSENQGVPAGMLSYWLNELSVNEIKLADTAMDEAAAATAYANLPGV